MAAKVRSKTLHSQPLTYSALLESQNQKVALGKLNSQTAANRATALRLFLRANHLQESDIVGSEMRTHFPDAVRKFATYLRDQGKTPRSISNTRSALTALHQDVVQHDTVVALAREQATPFQKTIRNVMEGHPVKRVARQAGISADILYGWLAGKVPRASNAKLIRRLETFFGLERESLVSLAGIKDGIRPREQVGVPPQITYRETLGQRSGNQYYLVVPLDSPLRAQWIDLMRYKTAKVPALRRSPAGRWTLAPLEVKRETVATWYEFLDGVEVSSAKSAWMKVASYLGWMALRPGYGGPGLREQDLQTLAWFAVPDYLEAYLEWMKRRCGNKHSRGVLTFFGLLGWMLRPGDGYLYQIPSLRETLPAEFRKDTWENMCSRQYDYCVKLKQALEQEVQVSRDPFAPLQPVLDLPEPLEALADMVQRMRMDRPVGNEIAEALWARDIFLVKLLASNPLRLRNMATLTWTEKNVDGHKPSNVGSLYQRGDGTWWIFVPKHLLKNRRSSGAIRDYDSPVHDSVWPDLERYLFKHRPKLIRWLTELVFLTKTRDPDALTKKYGREAKKSGPREHRPYIEMSKHLYQLTKKYLWKCNGIGTHAFRHLIATSILKSDGGDYKTAALVLNDREITVEKHYSGLRSGDGATRMGMLLDKSFRRM